MESVELKLDEVPFAPVQLILAPTFVWVPAPSSSVGTEVVEDIDVSEDGQGRQPRYHERVLFPHSLPRIAPDL